MTSHTALDTAHAAMDTGPDDAAARLRFYETVAQTELLLCLRDEATDDTITPDLFTVEDMDFVLAFDTEERLAEFAGKVVPYAALPGRALVQMMQGQSVGLALNPGVAPSSFLMPPDAVAWLAQTLEHGPREAEATPRDILPPAALPQVLLEALDQRLARAAGLARKAYLVQVVYADDSRGHLLGLTGVAPGAEPALARAVNEALVFSGIEAGALDVIFPAPHDPITATLARVGLRFDLPPPPEPVETPVRPAPGSDPNKPPILR